jgi:putative SOS response-associated peptidase YedK
VQESDLAAKHNKWGRLEMCGRFALTHSLSEIIAALKNSGVSDIKASDIWSHMPENIDVNLVKKPPFYNAAPMQICPALVKNSIGPMVWGYVPPWKNDDAEAAKLKNARAETVSQKPSFAENWSRSRRCLISISGFYEWSKGGFYEDQSGQRLPKAPKGPYFVHAEKGGKGDAQSQSLPLLFLAGLWSGFPSRQRRYTGIKAGFTVLTKPARDHLRHIHHREPVLFALERALSWMGESPEGAHHMMMADDKAVGLKAYQVSDAVGRVQEEGAALVKATPSQQSELLL